MNKPHPNIPQSSQLRTAAAALILCLNLVGCGGPKYSEKFADWFKMSTAEKIPVKIQDVDVEETAATGDSAIFQFTATGVTTEDLYIEESLKDPTVMSQMHQQFQQASLDGVSNNALLAAGGDAVLKTVQQSAGGAPTILKMATPKGSEVKFTGKGRAVLGNTNWEFATVELNQDPLSGTPRPAGKAFVLSGSTEHKKLIVAHKTAIENMQAVLELARNIDAEEGRVAQAESAESEAEAQAKLEKEMAEKAANEKLAEEQFLAKQTAIINKLAPGTNYLANWQGADSCGTLGMVLREGTKIGTSYSMDALLTNTPERTRSKKVTLALTGKGTDKAPFVLQINGIATGYSDEGNYRNYRNSGTGFVTEDTVFQLPLAINPETGSLSGILSADFSYGPKGPVSFEFKMQDSQNPVLHKPAPDTAIIPDVTPTKEQGASEPTRARVTKRSKPDANQLSTPADLISKNSQRPPKQGTWLPPKK